jgi:hypothetical protein
LKYKCTGRHITKQENNAIYLPALQAAQTTVAETSMMKDCHHDTKHRHDQDYKCVTYIVLSKPYAEGEQLEHIERFQQLQEYESDDPIDWNNNLIATINHTPATYKQQLYQHSSVNTVN